MLIKVKTLTGKEIEIDIEPTDKVERIKERVEEKEGIPPPQQVHISLKKFPGFFFRHLASNSNPIFGLTQGPNFLTQPISF